MALKTNYKDDILDTSKNTNKVYTVVDETGAIIHRRVSLNEVTEYSQEGDTFGASDINATNTEVNRLTESLNGFRFGVDSNGNYGYYKAGADTVTPFLGWGFNEKIYTKLIKNTTSKNTNQTYQFTYTVESNGYLYGMFGLDEATSAGAVSYTFNKNSETIAKHMEIPLDAGNASDVSQGYNHSASVVDFGECKIGDVLKATIAYKSNSVGNAYLSMIIAK